MPRATSPLCSRTQVRRVNAVRECKVRARERRIRCGKGFRALAVDNECKRKA